MTDWEGRAAELELKLAIATYALQLKHEENLELIQERNQWQAIAGRLSGPGDPLDQEPL